MLDAAGGCGCPLLVRLAPIILLAWLHTSAAADWPIPPVFTPHPPPIGGEVSQARAQFSYWEPQSIVCVTKILSAVSLWSSCEGLCLVGANVGPRV